MKAVKIQDMEPLRRVLAVDLRHVLHALAPRAISSNWRVRDVWATDEATLDFKAFDEQQIVSGARLLELAESAVQVIDGVFTGFESNSSHPWVIIEAVDSAYYVVHSDNDTVLDIIRTAFQEVSDYAEAVF